jgi:hypothetical protein
VIPQGKEKIDLTVGGPGLTLCPSAWEAKDEMLTKVRAEMRKKGAWELEGIPRDRSR